MFNVTQEIYKNIETEINNNNEINILLFDTETTGIIKPEITQFGYIVVKIIKNKETSELEFKLIHKEEKEYYPTKKLEIEAARITYMIREEELNNEIYIKEIINSFKNVNKNINKKFIEENFYILKKTLPKYQKEEFEEIVKQHKIKCYAGHNVFQYDYIEVLKNTYGINIKDIEIFDTMLTDIHNGTKKTNKGRKLSNEVNKIIKHLPEEDKEQIEKQIEERDNISHSALLDIEVNYYLFKYQVLKMKEEFEKSKLENITENNNDKSYDKENILYIRTHMSEQSILTEEQIINICKEKNINTIIIVDNQWTKYIELEKKFKEKDIKIINGIQVFNIDREEYSDIIIKNTKNYRLLLPLLKEGNLVSDQRLKDIIKYTENIVIPTYKMPTPKYLKKEDNLNFFLSQKILQNKAYTQQEINIFKSMKFEDESITTGLYTSEIKQKWFREKLIDFETVDFTFYASLGLSAFPPLNILHPAIDKEPETIEEALEMLDFFYEEQWELRKMDKIIEKSNFPKKAYQERKEKEFAILKKIGKIDFIKYFFLVYKIGNVMEGIMENDILDKDNPNFKIIREAFGPGRGSAPGSIIAFVTGTTGLDPLKYDLLFERFIDPSRPDYPDIDLDIVNKEFAFNILKQYFDEQMKNQIDYTKKPYDIYEQYIIDTYIKPENDFIGKIKTTAYTTKKVILGSLLRLNQMPFATQSIISKEFDAIVNENGGSDKDIKLEDIIEQSEVKEDILSKMPIEIFKAGNDLINIYKSSGIHAGGVLFFPHHPNVILPMKNNVVEFGMRDLESLLQIKMDLLGLKTREAIEDIKKLLIKEGKEDIIYKHNFDEMNKPEVFRGLFNKFTSQTFQMGSSGMDRLLYLLSPLKFEDLIAITALFRPGPLGSGAVDNYISSSIKAKREKYNIEYLDLKSWEKMDKELKEMLIEQYKGRMKKDFNEILLPDEVFETLITYENYYDSQKFQKQIETKFNSIDSPIIQELKAKYNITTIEEFKNKILELENKITAEEAFREITKDTYHTMVYQEQIMHISVQLANYTVLESNKLRKAIAKQNKEQMEIQKEKFISGLIKEKIQKVEYINDFEKYEISKTKTNEIYLFNKETNESKSIAGFLELNGLITPNEYTPNEYIDLFKKLNKQTENKESKITIKPSNFEEIEGKYFWDKIESFGAYAFNKSHSATYSVITYETQYYKEFATTIAYGVFLKHVKENAKMQLIKEIKARNIGLELQSLDKNISLNFSIDTKRDVIALPLTYIKGIGDKEILPFLELFKEYNIQSLEEMLLYSGAKPRKKIIDRLGQLSVLENTITETGEDFSYVSTKEFFYLSGENEDPDNKGIINSIFDKALKKPTIKNSYNNILKEFKVSITKKIKEGELIQEDYAQNIWVNQPLIASLQTMKILSENFQHIKNSSDGTEEEEKKVLQFFVDIQKSEENLWKEIEKLKGTKAISEEERKQLIKAIEDKNYDFYKKDKYEKTFNEYRLFFEEKIKELSKLLREEIKTQYNNLKINELLINKIGIEQAKERKLNKAEQAEINDRLLKEGNFDKNLSFDYNKKDDVINLKRKENCEEDLTYNRFYKTKDSKTIENNKANVIYLTEFLPKVAKEGFESAHPQYGSKTQQFFVDLYIRMEENLRDKVKLVWMSYHQMTEPQFNEKYIDNYIDKEEYENYISDRFKNILINIADSKVENIILATPLKSKLMANIKKYKFKGFEPQYGETTIVYLKNSRGEKVKKIFAFVPNMFPYKDLNPKKYEEDFKTIINLLKG